MNTTITKSINNVNDLEINKSYQVSNGFGGVFNCIYQGMRDKGHYFKNVHNDWADWDYSMSECEVLKKVKTSHKVSLI